MTEEVQGQGTGNAQFTPEGSGDQSQTQPKYVTVEQAQAMVDQAVQQATSKAQSLIDKSGNRLQAKVQENLKALEATLKLQADAGIVVTPEQREKLEQQAMKQAFIDVQAEDPNAQSNQQGPPKPPPDQGEPLDPITQAAWSMMKERGVDILESDPEFKILDMTSPYKFLLSVDKAITTKETRLQSSPNKEPNQTGSNPLGRIAGAGAGGSGNNTLLPDGTPPIDRLSRHYSQQGK